MDLYVHAIWQARIHFCNWRYSMRIDSFTNRAFCKPNQNYVWTSVNWVRSKIDPWVLEALHYPLKSKQYFRLRTSQTSRGPIELLVRFAKSSVRERVDAQTVWMPKILTLRLSVSNSAFCYDVSRKTMVDIRCGSKGIVSWLDSTCETPKGK